MTKRDYYYEMAKMIDGVPPINPRTNLPYVKLALRSTYGMYSSNFPNPFKPEIKKVIFNDPATIVIWKDGSKTVVKCGENDIYDKEKGLAMAIAKKAFGNKGNYYEEFKKWLPVEYMPTEEEPFKFHYNSKAIGKVESVKNASNGIEFEVSCDKHCSNCGYNSIDDDQYPCSDCIRNFGYEDNWIRKE